MKKNKNEIAIMLSSEILRNCSKTQRVVELRKLLNNAIRTIDIQREMLETDQIIIGKANDTIAMQLDMLAGYLGVPQEKPKPKPKKDDYFSGRGLN